MVTRRLPFRSHKLAGGTLPEGYINVLLDALRVKIRSGGKYGFPVKNVRFTVTAIDYCEKMSTKTAILAAGDSWTELRGHSTLLTWRSNSECGLFRKCPHQQTYLFCAARHNRVYPHQDHPWSSGVPVRLTSIPKRAIIRSKPPVSTILRERVGRWRGLDTCQAMRPVRPRICTKASGMK